MTKKFYRINQYIKAEKVRTIDAAGKQIGILSLEEALKKARESNCDLVEVAQNATPPVCKIINFKKFKYLEAKKEQEGKKKSKRVELKEIRLTPFIAENDFNFRIKRAEKFLKGGDKVKISVKFHGRQMGKKDFGYELIKKAIARLEDISKVNGEPKFVGNCLGTLLVPANKTIKDEKSKS